VPAGWYTLEITLDGYEPEESEPFIVAGNVKDKALRLFKAGESRGYSVSGVIGTDDGEGAAGARVKLRRDGLPVDGKTVDAGEDGAYTIKGVQEGEYSIEVSLAGYDTGTIPVFTVDGDVTGKDIELQKTVIIPGTHTISGTVSTSDGESAEGAEVQLRRGGESAGSVAFADDDGAYTIVNVATAVDYTIEVSLAGYDTGTIPLFAVSGDVAGKDIELQKTAATPPPPTLYSVSGTVSTSDSGSAQTAVVQRRQGGSAVSGKTASPDADGNYTITGVAEGSYTIEVSLAGYETGTIDDVEVDGDVTGKDITLQKTAMLGGAGTHTISGVVSKSDGGFASGASVQLRSSGSPVGSAVQAGTDGSYTITGVAAGT
jgi:hypothetical protein